MSHLFCFPFCRVMESDNAEYSHPITLVQYNCMPPFTLDSLMPNWLAAIRWQGSVAAGLEEVVLGDSEVHVLGREVQVNTVERKGRWKKDLEGFSNGLDVT